MMLTRRAWFSRCTAALAAILSYRPRTVEAQPSRLWSGPPNITPVTYTHWREVRNEQDAARMDAARAK